MSRNDTGQNSFEGFTTMAQNARIITILIGLFFICGPITAANADELFICDGNKNLRVPFDKLDHMKRTNACVAAHYGLEIEKKITPLASNKMRLHNLVSGPVRVLKKPVGAKTQAKKAAATETTVRTLPAKSAFTSDTSDVKIYKRGEALPIEEVGAEPSDHRNVKVLNAKSKPAKWFNHVY